jgi:hypothetical protein
MYRLIIDILLMGTSDLLRHQIIKSLPLLQTESISEGAVLIWEQMATQIVSIVGEGGFNSLYSRSLALTQSAYFWLEFDPHTTQTEQRFSELKMCLERQTPEHASAANLLLLITFTDILASLIGERLTTSILRLAWENDAADSDSKEIK